MHASSLWLDMTRRGLAALLPGMTFGGFYHDEYPAQDDRTAIARPGAALMFREMAPGDWVGTFSWRGLAWRNTVDYLRFMRLALKFGMGLAAAREQAVIAPGSVAAEAFDNHFRTALNVQKAVRSRGRLAMEAEPSGGRRRGFGAVIGIGRASTAERLWYGDDMGAMEVVSRLVDLGYKDRDIGVFLNDMGYRRDAYSRHHIAVARLIRDVKVPPRRERHDQSIVVGSMTKSEVQLVEAAANAAQQPLELWAIETLSKAAYAQLAKAQRQEQRIFAQREAKEAASAKKAAAKRENKELWSKIRSMEQIDIDPATFD